MELKITMDGELGPFYIKIMFDNVIFHLRFSIFSFPHINMVSKGKCKNEEHKNILTFSFFHLSNKINYKNVDKRNNGVIKPFNTYYVITGPQT